MYANIWNPYIIQSELAWQEQPLDLSVKRQDGTDQSTNIKRPEISFDFSKFYQTYQQISSRSWTTYPGSFEGLSSLQTSPASQREDRKRKSSGSSSESEDSSSGDEKRVRLLCGEDGTRKEGDNKKHSQKKRKDGAGQQIANIANSCDCRFCYEDHIIKMRLKTERPWMHLTQ